MIKLIEILRETHEERKDFKTIVFVKERVVAVYLQKILEGVKARSGVGSKKPPLNNH